MKPGLKVINIILNKYIMKKYTGLLIFLFLNVISIEVLFAQPNQKDTKNVKVYFEHHKLSTDHQARIPDNYGYYARIHQRSIESL